MNSTGGFHEVVKRCARRNRLRVTHDALGVQHITFGHVAAVHAELTHQDSLVFAVDFHIGTGGRKNAPPRGRLRPLVIHHRPKGPRIAGTLDGVGIDVIRGAVAVAHCFHFCSSRVSVGERQHNKAEPNSVLVCAVHAPNIN